MTSVRPATRCRLVASGRSTDPADWFDLTDELQAGIVNAVISGAPVVDVLRRHDVTRGTYYLWLAIGRGARTHWFDGCEIDVPIRLRCWRLAVAVAEAHLARDQRALAALRQAPHSNGVRLHVSSRASTAVHV